jgi:hypothetical protein
MSQTFAWAVLQARLAARQAMARGILAVAATALPN